VTYTVSASVPALLQEYYRILTVGAQSCGEGQGLRVLLSDHLDFAGSVRFADDGQDDITKGGQ